MLLTTNRQQVIIVVLFPFVRLHVQKVHISDTVESVEGFQLVEQNVAGEQPVHPQML